MQPFALSSAAWGTDLLQQSLLPSYMAASCLWPWPLECSLIHPILRSLFLGGEYSFWEVARREYRSRAAGPGNAGKGWIPGLC